MRATLAAIAAGGFGLSVSVVCASPVYQGDDYFRSLPGTYVDLTSFGLGVVDMEGNPFAWGSLPLSAGTDTIVRRKDDVDPLEPPNDTGTIDIEIVALSLRSVNPMDLTPLGGPFVGVFADMYTTINKDGMVPGLPQPDQLMPSIGLMEIRHEYGPTPGDDIGGTFDSAFGDPSDGGVYATLGVAGGGVYADAIFTIPGGDPTNPGDVLMSQAAPRVIMHSLGSGWEHTGYASFQVTEIDHQGPHSVEPIFPPAPAGAALLALGGLISSRRR